MDDAAAVEASARRYVEAAMRRDYEAMWQLFSQGARGVCLAAAKAQGLPPEDGFATLGRVAPIPNPSPDEPTAFSIEVLRIEGNVAVVGLSPAPDGHAAELPFVLENGAWLVGVAGPDDVPLSDRSDG